MAKKHKIKPLFLLNFVQIIFIENQKTQKIYANRVNIIFMYSDTQYF